MSSSFVALSYVFIAHFLTIQLLEMALVLHFGELQIAKITSHMCRHS